ncbi:MAG: GDSL-type esterase/lipase family protein [Kiritimatiellae bacterium]|nr:GDSL-type esterase/lipase family protein [Kiritimatiellia bacterium]
MIGAAMRWAEACRGWWVCCAGALLLTVTPALPAARFADQIAAFDREDAARPPPADPIVFTGSSSIRLWTTLTNDFPGAPVLNRGFGGATMRDLLERFDRVVAAYRPRALVVYCGENDVALGRDPIETANDYIELIRRCRLVRPDMKILVVLMKPSPRRWHLWTQFKAANRRIQEICVTEGVAILDVAPAMLGADGCPRPELYRDDRLHLTALGYHQWAEQIREWLRREGLIAPAASLTP